jgi:hypothetical protein
MRLLAFAGWLLLSFVPLCIYSQEQPDQSAAPDKIANFPTKLFDRISGQSTDLQAQLVRQTEKYLRRMGRQEQKLRARLYKQDSAKAAALYPTDPRQQYAFLAQKLRQDSTKVFSSMGPEYLPNADSLQGALGFLNKNPSLLNANPALQAKMQGSLGQLQQLQSKLQQADAIKQYIQSRKTQIQQYLSQYSHLPAGISSAFQGYNKEAYYYADQVRQYRAMLNDPDKMMQEALVLLNKLPAFTSFMKNNGFLTGLFSVPAGYGTAEGMAGLQTRDQVLAMIQNQVGSGGPSAASSIQQSLQSASQDITKLQNKLSSMGAGSGDMDMPDFKPNDQKKKTFLKRLEVGANMQTTRNNYLFPTITDLGLSIGYKLGHGNDCGVGGSFKLGWGNGINHIAFSGQGVGLRSFLDVKLKSTFFISGGFEYNYTTPFVSYQQIEHLSYWTQSGLIGVSKTIAAKGLPTNTEDTTFAF